MNEITKIHLGRQAFTVSVDAHKELQEYLRAIKRHMGDTDEAVEEVEMRMAELLAERGVSGDKVVLSKDIDYLKEQLGEPGDFGEEEAEKSREDTNAPKRLFRDTDDAMLAGVSSGMAKYLGIDPLWIRLAFIALVFAGGSGILIYIILWLLVPEAKTSSERLQMQGKPVTVDALKDVVERADVEGAARRATNTVGKAVHSVLKVILGVIGAALAIAGAAAIMGLLTATTYLLVHGSQVNNQVVFPVGTLETVAAVCALAVVLILSIFLLVSGMAMIKRRWPLPGWATGSLVALFVVAGGVGTALALDSVPRVSDRVDAAQKIDAPGCQENVFSYCPQLHKNDLEIEFPEPEFEIYYR